MLLPFLCVLLLPLSIPSLVIAYRKVTLSDQSSDSISLIRLVKNKFLGSVFNITTTLMNVLLGNIQSSQAQRAGLFDISSPGITVPISSAVSISLMAGSEDGRELVCTLRPFLTWNSDCAIIIVGFLSLLYK